MPASLTTSSLAASEPTSKLEMTFSKASLYASPASSGMDINASPMAFRSPFAMRV